MTVYQIVIQGEEGQTFAHDIFWFEKDANKWVEELIKDSDYSECSFKVVPKTIREM